MGFSFRRFFLRGRPNRAIKTLSAACKRAASAVLLTHELDLSIRILMDRVTSSFPLLIQMCSQDTWILFTDGTCEPEKCWGGIRAVLFSPNRDSLENQLNAACAASWLFSSPKYELEIAPILISLELWKGILSELGTRTFVAMHMQSLPTPGCFDIASKKLALQLRSWPERVGTASNVAAGPSRLDFSSEPFKGCVGSRPFLSPGIGVAAGIRYRHAPLEKVNGP